MVRLRPQPLKDLNDHAELTARTPPAERVRARGASPSVSSRPHSWRSACFTRCC